MVSRVLPSVLLGLVTVGFVDAIGNGQQAPIHDYSDACPAYTDYAMYSHRPLSTGPLSLPFQRPERRCRTFHSDEIERVIDEVTSRLKDPDLARLFENAFPSTTDTTVKFHTKGTKDFAFERIGGYRGPQDDGAWEGPQSFIITGDIIAEWLRDSTHQLRPYQPLAKKDPAIFDLILGAINTQSEYVIESPYCNAFQPPAISNLAVTDNGQDDLVHPAYEPSTVFECKYELDSLASFLKLANDFHEHTGSSKFLNKRWYLAVDTLLGVLEQQSKPTFDPETGRYIRNAYTFQRSTNTGTETLNLQGIGNPLNSGTGLVRSAFRPSDDATILGFFIPANAMMSVELERTSKIVKTAGNSELATKLKTWSETIRAGVLEHGVVKHKKYGDVFAYEVDGFGSSIMMDDANYPSLLALPVMGFCDVSDPVYQNTRKMILDKLGNPYYLKGRDFRGIGGPHVGLKNAWPMSLLFQAQTSNDDDEIKECLDLVLKSSKLGLIHETVDVNYLSMYTRSWFAWANGVFAVTILDIAKRKPHLIFEKGTAPYEI
ncbi:Meiotically up-regulated gene protein [Cladobotryum mycophilum]|uniref:Meiotically up-regulated gene protein n=1 Tax=Cladobotryum mycophilum TaxID=491253 RepID=A0ABR0T171_9HYPO